MGKELNTQEWKKILDEIHREGCFWLTLSGGDPLVRKDFLDIYSYAKGKGFIITLFTNAYGITRNIMDYLTKAPPFLIEITLNGATKKTYESITRIKGSFAEVVNNIKTLAKRRIKLKLKTNCLKQNKHELARIKSFTEEILGRPSKNTHYFKYDTVIYPCLNGNSSPIKYRLSNKELLEAKKQDRDIWEEYQGMLKAESAGFNRSKDFLYHCNSWVEQFFINPFGRLKFCQFSKKFSTDLKHLSFKEGFYNVFPRCSLVKFKTNSPCRSCDQRQFCYFCPSRAFIETGNEEGPVPYYCQLAKAFVKERGKVFDKN